MQFCGKVPAKYVLGPVSNAQQTNKNKPENFTAIISLYPFSLSFYDFHSKPLGPLDGDLQLSQSLFIFFPVNFFLSSFQTAFIVMSSNLLIASSDYLKLPLNLSSKFLIAVILFFSSRMSFWLRQTKSCLFVKVFILMVMGRMVE